MNIGYGIFAWDGIERRNRRYGSFFLDDRNFNDDAYVVSRLNHGDLNHLQGKRVLIQARVVETRDSGHAGDAFLSIKPSRPAKDEIVSLGVGILRLGRNYENQPTIELMPGDGRAELWLDPRLLYRLHDQTVEISVEETDEKDHPVPDLHFASGGVVANGDGTLQYSGVEPEEGDKLMPEAKKLGDGLFSLSFPSEGRVSVLDRHGGQK